MTYAKVEHTAEQLLSIARVSTGIDIIDNAIQAPLEQLLQSLNTEAKLSDKGAIGIRKRLLRILCNRLRMQRDFKQHPEINDIEVSRPVFITSAPRTGSTKLHKLLAESGDFRYLKCWQGQCLSLRTGDRNEAQNERINDSEEENAFFNEQAPLAKLIHEYSTHEPEEDVLIYEHFFYAPYYNSFTYVPSYVNWYSENRNIEAELGFLKDSLKYLQWQFQEDTRERWILKAPHYNGSENFILEVFPDAQFLVTHRDPIITASSLPSLYAHFLQAYSNTDWSEVVGPIALNGIIYLAQLHLNVRDSYPEIEFLDISYSDIIGDIETVISQAYQHLKMPLNETSRQRMLDWNTANTQHKKGVHKHNLDKFSLDKQVVEQQLADYKARFSQYF